MGWEAWLTLAVVVACFAMMALTWISPDIVMSAGLTLLLVSGVLLPEEALAGFANQGMLTVAVLYVVVSGLTETGAIAWIVQHILRHNRRDITPQTPDRFLSNGEFLLKRGITLWRGFLNITFQFRMTINTEPRIIDIKQSTPVTIHNPDPS